MTPVALRRISLGMVCTAGLLAACAMRAGNGNISATAGPASTADNGNVSATAGPDAALDQVDAALRATLQGSLAFNAPTDIALDDTTTVTLLLSPTLSEAELQQALGTAEPVISAAVAVTPRMRAELVASPAEAFEIQPVHADAEQLLSTVEPTTWAWNVTAHQEGRHRLTLSVYRLVTVDGRDYWRQVAYTRDVDVTVSFVQRLALLDWKWIVGLVVTGIAVPIVQTLLKRRRRSRRPGSPA